MEQQEEEVPLVGEGIDAGEYRRYLEVLKEMGLTNKAEEVHAYRWIARAERDVMCRNLKRLKDAEENGKEEPSTPPLLLFAEDEHLPKLEWGKHNKDFSKNKLWCSATAPAWVDYLLSIPVEHEVVATTSSSSDVKEKETAQQVQPQPQQAERGGKGKRGKRGKDNRGGRGKGGRQQRTAKAAVDMGESRRHGYAVIAESAPCFGFMDAEFDPKLNPDNSMQRMLSTFLEYYIETWREVFSPKYPDLPVPTLDHFLILDASSEDKASKHVHGPFYFAFRNVYHQAAFIHQIFKRIENVAKRKRNEDEGEKGHKKPDLETSYLAKECLIKVKQFLGIVERPFMDLPVYSHNRCFRMYSCCKAGSNRAMKEDTAFPINEKVLTGIPPVSEGIERERAILFHTIIDASVYPFLEPSSANEGKKVIVLDYPDQEAVNEVLPRNAFQREGPKAKTRKPAFVLSSFTACKGDTTGATHFEEASKKRETTSSEVKLHYKLEWPADKASFFKSITHAITGGRSFNTFEIMTPVTRLMMELTLTKESEDNLTQRTDREKVMREEMMPKHLPHLQKAIASLLEVESKEVSEELFECYLLKEAESHLRLVWPQLFVEREKGDALIEELKKRLEAEDDGKQALSAFNIPSGLYQRGHVRLLGATSVTPLLPSGQNSCPVKLLGVYGKDGVEIMVGEVRKKVKLSSWDVLQATSCLDTKHWRPSSWSNA